MKSQALSAARQVFQLLIATAVISVSGFAQSAPQWDTGVYVYDASGNIVRMGLDEYHYDKTNRLTYATADQQRAQSGLRQEYGYDSFGNRVTVRNCSTECVQRGLPAAQATNHLNDGTTYNDAGAIADGPTGSPTHHYAYDPMRMLSAQTAGGSTVQYVYTADDQRIAVNSSGDWQWSVRDLSQRVALDLTSSDGSSPNWTTVEDYVQGGCGFVGSASALGRRHAHVDHLGSPRVITDDGGRLVGQHVYYAFGEALEIGTEAQPERLHFTGHERDSALGGESLDYMHARYYSAAAGRFLSVDPELGDARTPQSWNRYAYVRNAPIGRTDPTGQQEAQAIQVFESEIAPEIPEIEEAAVQAVEQDYSGAKQAVQAAYHAAEDAVTYVSVRFPRTVEAVQAWLRSETGTAEAPPETPKGEFNVSNWHGYPEGQPKPEGSLRVVKGEEYNQARKAANAANRAIHKANPQLAGKQIHEIKPVKFGGSPTSPANKVALTPKEHAALTTWWNRLLKTVTNPGAK